MADGSERRLPFNGGLADEVAIRVAQHIDYANAKPDEITQAVLNSLTVDPPVDSRPTFLLFDLRRPRAA